ncbi:MAG: NAD(P)-binding domain-containing protein [Phycisphaerales bacterium]|jgi:thioredoxin reductase (NADPH)|nr:NAD(P)-binding domain-containing protein [Phycisphaerales bacterium]
MKSCEVLIVGAGPIGLEVAWHVRSACQDTLHVDAGAVGETIARLFPPATRFFSSPERIAIAGVDLPVPTQEKITGEEYLAYLRSVAITRDLPVQTFHRVVAAEPSSEGFSVTMEELSGRRHHVHASKVVLACGGTHRPRTLGVPGEDLPHVTSHLGNPHRFFGRRVLIVGGKNSAVESALRCWRVHAEVTLCLREEEIHERVKYWLRPEVMALIEEGKITAHRSSRVVSIEPGIARVEHMATGATTDIDADDVILQIGYEQDDALFRLFGVTLTEPQGAPSHNPETLETDVAGVFVAGTAIAGTQQRFKAYIETSHDHGPRIAAAIAGAAPPPPQEARILPEA